MKLVLGGGCFWCVEAVFAPLPGVSSVELGYAAPPPHSPPPSPTSPYSAAAPAPSPTPATPHPTLPSYESVCAGDGHIEVARVEFDTGQISLEKILKIFLAMHDPTSADRQGADAGVQYRSALFYEDEGARARCAAFLVGAGADFARPILTQLYPLREFFRAEDYHQNYFAKNPNAAYCQAVITPKIAKVKGAFKF